MNNAGEDFKYTGVDNLEIMLEAQKYNRFLTNLVLKHRSGTGTMLDFGAGLGTFSGMLRERGFDVDCVEVDKAECAILQQKGFKVFQDTAAIADESYDYVFSLNVFEHIEQDEAAMKECSRILRPGGRALTYVPAFQVLYGDMDRKVEHFRRYTRRSLADLADASCMTVVKTEYVDFAGYFATLLFNATSKGSGDINKGSIRIYDRYIFPLSRILDSATHSFLGKNVFMVSVKRGGGNAT
jgi:SAM-dependent methyltransferase